jgi:hypothetical protein
MSRYGDDDDLYGVNRFGVNRFGDDDRFEDDLYGVNRFGDDDRDYSEVPAPSPGPASSTRRSSRRGAAAAADTTQRSSRRGAAAAASSTPVPDAAAAAAAASSTPAPAPAELTPEEKEINKRIREGVGSPDYKIKPNESALRLAKIVRVSTLTNAIKNGNTNKIDELRDLTLREALRVANISEPTPYNLINSKSGDTILNYAYRSPSTGHFIVLQSILENFASRIVSVIKDHFPAEYKTLARHVLILYLTFGPLSSIIRNLKGELSSSSDGAAAASAAASSSDTDASLPSSHVENEDLAFNSESASQEVDDFILTKSDIDGAIIPTSKLRHIRELLIILLLNLFSGKPITSKIQDNISEMKSITKEIPHFFRTFVNFNSLDDTDKQKIIDVLEIIKFYLISILQGDYLYTDIMNMFSSSIISSIGSIRNAVSYLTDKEKHLPLFTYVSGNFDTTSNIFVSLTYIREAATDLIQDFFNKTISILFNFFINPLMKTSSVYRDEEDTPMPAASAAAAPITEDVSSSTARKTRRNHSKSKKHIHTRGSGRKHSRGRGRSRSRKH